MSAGQIDVRDLHVRIAGKEILHGLHFTAAAGRRTAIVGPNGAGKTTLLRAVAGLNRRYTGEILLDGKELGRFSERALARVRAILPQERAAVQGLTVRQLVAYGRFAHTQLFQPRDTAEDSAAIAWAMDIAHVSAFAAREVHTLSGGERQRVFLAMALSQRPKLLLLDEPTSALDFGNQLRVIRVVRDLIERGYAVIMTTHNPDHAIMLNDRVGILDREGCLTVGSMGEVVTEDTLSRVYKIPVRIVEVPEVGRRAALAPL